MATFLYFLPETLLRQIGLWHQQALKIEVQLYSPKHTLKPFLPPFYPERYSREKRFWLSPVFRRCLGLVSRFLVEEPTVLTGSFSVDLCRPAAEEVANDTLAGRLGVLRWHVGGRETAREVQPGREREGGRMGEIGREDGGIGRGWSLQ